MNNYEVIHVYIFRPDKALFKEASKGKAEVEIVSCCNKENCDLYKRGECLIATLFGPACPYGRMRREEGFSMRARKYGQWIHEKETLYEDAPSINGAKNKLAVIGDYVYLPYAHMTMCKDVPFLRHDSLLVSGRCLLPLADLSVEVVTKLVHFKPQSLMGGTIKSYQKEVPPVFLKHLSERFPELFRQVLEVDKYAKERFEEFSNVGRKAILDTLTSGVGEFKDIHGGTWSWDGEILKSTNSHILCVLVNKFEEVWIRPQKNQEVCITDEAQVNENTVFVT